MPIANDLLPAPIRTPLFGKLAGPLERVWSQFIVAQSTPWAQYFTGLSVRLKQIVDALARLEFIEVSTTLDFPATAGNSHSDLTVTVPGAVIGDYVMLTFDPSVYIVDSYYAAAVSAPDTVTIRFSNTAGPSINPPAGTYYVRVWRR